MNILLNKIKLFFQDKNPVKIIAILIVIAAVPLTVFIAQQSQEIRQRASENANSYQIPVLSLKYFPVKPCGSPAQKIDLSTAIASSAAFVREYPPKNIIDGSMDSKWMPTGPFNQVELFLDLGTIKTLKTTMLRFYSYDLPEKYHIDVSETGAFAGEQTRIATETNSFAGYTKQGKSYSFDQVNARYVKLSFDAYRSNNIAGNGYQVNLYEWEFYSDLPFKKCIDTTITGTDGIRNNPDDPEPLNQMRDRLINDNQTIIDAIKEGSKYHGYKDPNSVSSIIPFIYEDKEFLTAVPVSPIYKTNPPRPDYNGILNNLNICDYVDNKGVKEVWMWGYHSWQTVPEESDMAMGKNSRAFWNMPQSLPGAKWNALQNGHWGDISNSSQTNDLPVCNKTYVLFNFSYNSGVANALHNYFHQMENVLGYADREMFWDMYTGKQYGFAGPRRCGNAHAPPNLDGEYNYAFKNYVKSDCENWQPVNCISDADINAGCGGQRESINCDKWGCTDIKFYIWWMQNIPGLNNSLTYQGKNLRNWWEFFGDFDNAMAKGKSLLYESAPTSIPVSVALKLSPSQNQLFKGQDFNVLVSLDPGQYKITGVDFKLVYDKDLFELTSFQSSSTFLNNVLINKINNDAGNLHFAAVNTIDAIQPSNVPLGTITFKTKSVGTALVKFQDVQITARYYKDFLPYSNGSGTYIITNPNTPTPTTTPVLIGDINKDGSVDILDFNIWKDEFNGTTSKKTADLNNDGKVDLVDYNIWRSSLPKG